MSFYRFGPCQNCCDSCVIYQDGYARDSIGADWIDTAGDSSIADEEITAGTLLVDARGGCPACRYGSDYGDRFVLEVDVLLSGSPRLYHNVVYQVAVSGTITPDVTGDFGAVGRYSGRAAFGALYSWASAVIFFTDESPKPAYILWDADAGESVCAGSLPTETITVAGTAVDGDFAIGGRHNEYLYYVCEAAGYQLWYSAAQSAYVLSTGRDSGIGDGDAWWLQSSGDTIAPGSYAPQGTASGTASVTADGDAFWILDGQSINWVGTYRPHGSATGDAAIDAGEVYSDAGLLFRYYFWKIWESSSKVKTQLYRHNKTEEVTVGDEETSTADVGEWVTVRLCSDGTLSILSEGVEVLYHEGAAPCLDARTDGNNPYSRLMGLGGGTFDGYSIEYHALSSPGCKRCNCDYYSTDTPLSVLGVAADEDVWTSGDYDDPSFGYAPDGEVDGEPQWAAGWVCGYGTHPYGTGYAIYDPTDDSVTSVDDLDYKTRWWYRDGGGADPEGTYVAAYPEGIYRIAGEPNTFLICVTPGSHTLNGEYYYTGQEGAYAGWYAYWSTDLGAWCLGETLGDDNPYLAASGTLSDGSVAGNYEADGTYNGKTKYSKGSYVCWYSSGYWPPATGRWMVALTQLPVSLAVAGTLDPDVIGTYPQYGWIDLARGKGAAFRKGATIYYCWYSTEVGRWLITGAAPGEPISWHANRWDGPSGYANGPGGSYTAQGTWTGTATVTATGEMWVGDSSSATPGGTYSPWYDATGTLTMSEPDTFWQGGSDGPAGTFTAAGLASSPATIPLLNSWSMAQGTLAVAFDAWSIQAGSWTFVDAPQPGTYWRASPDLANSILLTSFEAAEFPYHVQAVVQYMSTGDQVRLIVNWVDADNYSYAQVACTAALEAEFTLHSVSGGSDTAVGPGPLTVDLYDRGSGVNECVVKVCVTTEWIAATVTDNTDTWSIWAPIEGAAKTIGVGQGALVGTPLISSFVLADRVDAGSSTAACNDCTDCASRCPNDVPPHEIEVTLANLANAGLRRCASAVTPSPDIRGNVTEGGTYNGKPYYGVGSSGLAFFSSTTSQWHIASGTSEPPAANRWDGPTGATVEGSYAPQGANTGDVTIVNLSELDGTYTFDWKNDPGDYGNEQQLCKWSYDVNPTVYGVDRIDLADYPESSFTGSPSAYDGFKLRIWGDPPVLNFGLVEVPLIHFDCDDLPYSDADTDRSCRDWDAEEVSGSLFESPVDVTATITALTSTL